MSKVNPRLIHWIVAVHRHPGLNATHRDILTYLAVMKLDYGTGTGYCSLDALANGRDCHPATVKRALDLAQKAALLKRTRWGHYISPGVAAASEWQVIYPAMPTAQPRDVGADPTAHQGDVGNEPTAQSSQANSALVHPIR
jgi:hypothetical protein